MLKFYITGVSGVGKTTVVAELNKRGITSFDIDNVKDLCHWRNKTSGEASDYYSGIGRDWLEAHEWICDVKKLKELLGEHKDSIVIAGLVSNQDEYLNLFDKIFLLHCNEATFLHRLSTRNGDNDFARDKSEQEHILSWYHEYEDRMVTRGAISINTESPLNVVVDRIVAEIRSK